MDLANKLINLRVHNKLSQRDLAEKLNLSEELIAAWEKGEKEPGASQLAQISKIFGISIDELLGVSENKSSFNPLAGFALPILDFNKQDCNTDNDDEEDEEYIRALIATTSAVDLLREKKKK
ncbi:MAG: helix-turn-helix transcriptional regulator [Clostridia bacterium]|jgi:transcriptional regulator with XRE-family HTH domain|nr:helix-turn-helix transcriptional regulator [Clostridia bacterium]